MSNRQIFLIIYFGGISLTLVYGLLLTKKVPFISSEFLLALGITHVLALFLLTAFRNERSNRKIEDGNFIQTAGYLHTLIGFLVAVGLVGDNIANINNLLPPLSSALITSLLGWCLGGFIVSQGEYEHETQKLSLNEEIAQAVAKEVAKALNKELEKYSNRVSRSFDKLKKTSESLELSFVRLNTTIETQGKNLDKSFNELVGTIDTKKTDLDTSFQEMSDVVKKQKQPLSNSFQEINKILDSQQQPLSNSFQKINNVLSQQAKLLEGNVNSWSNSLGKIETNLDNFSQNSKNASHQMSQTATYVRQTGEEANNVSQYLQNTKNLWLQLEELTQYIQRVTQ